jgi:hypothetical protein
MAAVAAELFEVDMRCANCGCSIENKEDAVWVRGTGICPACAQKSRELGRTLFTVWVVVAIAVIALPILLCLGGFFLFRFLR